MHTRINEVRKISIENQIILKKLKETKPFYNHKKWENDDK